MAPDFPSDPRLDLPDAMPAAPQVEDYLNADARSGATENGKPSYTIYEAANQIIRGEPGWSGQLGTPFTVTYAYRASAPLGGMPSDTGGFSQFTAAQIHQTELAFRAWSDVANIHFVRVGFGDFGAAAYSNNAAILLGDYSTGEAGAAAFAFFPGSVASSSSSGDVWVNSTLSYNLNPAAGNYGGTVLIHELGHAIGLEHPSDYNESPDVTLSYGQDASYSEDDRQYTVMSYFGEANTAADYHGDYPATPMLDDIAAAQLEYGANMSTRTGDTVYGFNSNAGEPWFAATSSQSRLVVAIWDAGGTDTLDVSGYGQNQLIDLRAGDFSNIGGLVGNVAIAQSVTIEDAIGGPGNDVIHGNAAGNTLIGGAGNDTIDGGVGGRNQILGLEGNDSITGGQDFDDVNGNKGNDTIDGGSGGADNLLGGQGNDVITVHASNNFLNGNLGSDTLNGGAGADTIHGGQFGDLLFGGGGDDHLFGDLGDDTLNGGAGADVFHIQAHGGRDLVVDFGVADGDRVQLDPGTNYALLASGADTVITLLDTGDQLTLANVSPLSLAPGSIFLA